MQQQSPRPLAVRETEHQLQTQLQGPSGSFEAMTGFLSEQQDKFVVLLREERDTWQRRVAVERETAERQTNELEAKLRAALELENVATTPQPAPPVEVISSQQIATLQARLEAMHAAKLLSEDQLCAIEDIVADFLELRCETNVMWSQLFASSLLTLIDAM